MKFIALIAAWAVPTAYLATSSLGVAQEGVTALRGQRLFIQCQACHSLQAGVSANVGPTLAGVVGRHAASIPDYEYSQALRSAALVWDEATLDKWLAHPEALVPGTKMIFAGVTNRVDRQAIIAYLEKAPDAK